MTRGGTSRPALAAALLLAATVGCGGESAEAPRPSGSAMTGPTRAAEREGANAAPVVERLRLNPSDPLPGVVLTAVAEASDPDGDALRLAYVWRVNGREVERGARPSIVLQDLAKDDDVSVEVTATDGRLESAPRRASARVPNRPPLLDAVAIEPEGTVRPGDELVAVPLARDPDEDELRYRVRWLVNGAERGTERNFATRGLTRGSRIVAEVVASDGEDETRAVRSSEIVLGNTPPRITRLPELENQDGTFRYAFDAVDPDGDANLRFWLDQAPEGMRVDPITGEVEWTPEPSQVGVHPVEIGVRDASGDGSTFLFEVTVRTQEGGASPPANAAP
jgi:hypothetical protein